MIKKSLSLKIFGIFLISILYIFLFPFQFMFHGDDVNVIAEYVFMDKNIISWLNHLLFFNQNRFTYNGDYLLIRPFLFFNTWFFDVFFREERIIHYFLCFIISIVAAYIIFKEFLISIGLISAILSVLIFFTIDYNVGSIVFYWSHLVPYILSLIFYYYGIKYTAINKFYTYIVGMILLQLSVLSHEYIFIALCLLFLYNNLTYENNSIIYKFNFRISIVIVINLFIYLYVFIIIRIPEIFAPGELANSNILEKFNNGFFSSLVLITKKVYLIKIPLLVSILFLFLQHKLSNINNINLYDKIKINSYTFAFVSITIGISLGRVLTRGGYSGWYNIMLAFYFLLLVSILFKYYKTLGKKNIIIFLIIILSITTIKNSLYDADNDQNINAFSLEKTSDKIINTISKKDNSCFGGIYLENQFDLNSIELLLYKKSCAYLLNNIPIYFDIHGDYVSLKYLQTNKVNKEILIDDRYMHINSDKYILNYFKDEIKGNFYSKNIVEINNDKIECKLIKIDKNSDFILFINSEDKYPTMYNFFISFKSNNEKNYSFIGFANNKIKIHSNINNIIKNNTIWSSNQKSTKKLYFTLINEGYLIFDNTNILGYLPIETISNDNLKLSYCNFNNGSGFEKLKKITMMNKNSS